MMVYPPDYTSGSQDPEPEAMPSRESIEAAEAAEEADSFSREAPIEITAPEPTDEATDQESETSRYEAEEVPGVGSQTCPICQQLIAPGSRVKSHPQGMAHYTCPQGG
jgi:hypothetical protein